MNIRGIGCGFAGLVALMLGACASTPPEKDPVQIKLADLDARVTRIERVVSNQALLGMSNDIQTLRQQVAALRNEVDILTNNFDTNLQRQRSLYSDLDQRIGSLEPHSSSGGSGAAAATGAVAAGAGAAAASAAGKAPALPVPDGTDRANYQVAFAELKDSQYDKAISGFQAFLASFPESSLADNAQYWLGEAYYVNKDFSAALGAFQRVIDKYPQSRKVPDAMLKVGYCRYELKQYDQAKAVLTEVANKYPDSPAGQLAAQRLEKIGAEKH